MDGPTGISTAGAHFPHLGQSPYGAPLLSHTEKQHQDHMQERKALSNLFKAIISVSAEARTGAHVDSLNSHLIVCDCPLTP